MSISDSLRKFRSSGSDNAPDKKEDKKEETVRSIKLSDEEMSPLAMVPDGERVTCQVQGKKEGNRLHVMSVQYTGGAEPEEGSDADMTAMAAKVAAPMIQ